MPAVQRVTLLAVDQGACIGRSDMWTRRRAGHHNGACCSARTAARCSWVAHAGSVGADPHFHGSMQPGRAVWLVATMRRRTAVARAELGPEIPSAEATGPALLPEACRLIKCSEHVDARAPGSRVEGISTEQRTRCFVVRLVSRYCAAPPPRDAPFRPILESPFNRCRAPARLCLQVEDIE